MNKRTLQGAGQKSPANTSAPFDPTNLRLPSEPPRRADGRLKGRSRDKLKSWEQDAAIAEVKKAQWQRFWNWIATAAIESPLVPKQPPGSHVRGSRWEQVRGMLIEELGGAANLTQLQIGLVGNLALLTVEIEVLEGQSIRGEQVDLKVLASLSSQLLRTSVALGLGRTQAPHNPLAAILFPKKP
jgi:hypothetical protein